MNTSDRRGSSSAPKYRLDDAEHVLTQLNRHLCHVRAPRHHGQPTAIRSVKDARTEGTSAVDQRFFTDAVGPIRIDPSHGAQPPGTRSSCPMVGTDRGAQVPVPLLQWAPPRSPRSPGTLQHGPAAVPRRRSRTPPGEVEARMCSDQPYPRPRQGAEYTEAVERGRREQRRTIRSLRIPIGKDRG